MYRTLLSTGSPFTLGYYCLFIIKFYKKLLFPVCYISLFCIFSTALITESIVPVGIAATTHIQKAILWEPDSVRHMDHDIVPPNGLVCPAFCRENMKRTHNNYYHFKNLNPLHSSLKTASEMPLPHSLGKKFLTP